VASYRSVLVLKIAVQLTAMQHTAVTSSVPQDTSTS
jgi:hypothetical protein